MFILGIFPTKMAVSYEPVKLGRMMDAVRGLLVGIGEDPTREGLRDTPKVRSSQSNQKEYIFSLSTFF